MTIADPGIPPLDFRVEPLPDAIALFPQNARPTVQVNPSGFLTIQAPVINPTSAPLNFRYSWQWFGADGMSPSNPVQQVWRASFIDPGSSTMLHSTSTVPKPSAVILRLSAASL